MINIAFISHWIGKVILTISGERTTSANGSFGSNSIYCNSSGTTSLDGSYSINVSDNLNIKTFKSTFNVSTEWINSSSSISGLSFGGYIKDSAVSNDANGNITGVGINTGYYGASIYDIASLQYYVALGVGYHSYELNIDKYEGGNIYFYGNYRYLTGLTGLAMSIKKHIHGITFEPRLGVNRSYALASEASINATQGEENAYLKFNPSNYNSTSYYIDSEIYKKFNLSEITNKISVKPKLWFRYDSIDGENYGNELEIKFSISSQYNNFSLLYSIKESDAYTSKSIKIRLSRELHSGQLSLINSFNKNGNANINLSYTSNF